MNRYDDDLGAVAVITALLAVVLLSMAAFVVDLGLARDSKRQAQNTADAAALAAANALYATRAPNLNQPGDFEAAVDAAKSYAAENYGTTEAEWASCSTDQALEWVNPGTGTDCISFDSYHYPSQALVVVPLRQQPVFFGAVVGYEGATISALAQAQLDPGGQRLCTFCVLGDGPHDLQNGDLNVTGGNVWFNGNVLLNPGGEVNSVEGDVVGDDGSTIRDGGNTYASGTISGGSVPNGQAGQPRVVDPLAAEEMPFLSIASLEPKPGGDACDDGPGIYEGINRNGGVCRLDEGLYVFTGQINLAGGAMLVGDGVTIYFACGEGTDYEECGPPEREGGGIWMAGGSGYQLTAPLATTHPDVDPELYGYSVVWDRYNTSNNRMRGNADSFATGTLYGFNAKLDIGGTAGSGAAFSSWVVIGGLSMNGGGELNVNFDASKNRRPSEGARGLVR